MHKLLPLALKGIGLLGMAGGAALGAKGATDIQSSNGRIEKAAATYEAAYKESKTREEYVNTGLKNLGDWQEHSIRVVVDRMADFLRRHQKQVKENEKLLADGLEAAAGRVSVSEAHTQDPVEWARAVLGSTAAGFSLNRGLMGAMKSFGKASTGTSISSLNGAAKSKALLAAFGGGSKATGGGGIASGKVALNLVTIGPAVLVTGLFVAGQGLRAKTKARAAEAQVSIEIANLNAKHVLFDAVSTRTSELYVILDDLTRRATAALDLLESAPFDFQIHGAQFHDALTLTMAVRDVATTPVVDSSGDLNEETANLKIKYRNLNQESGNV